MAIKYYSLLFTIFLFLVLHVDCLTADPEAKGTQGDKRSSEIANGNESVNRKVGSVIKDKDQVSGLKTGVDSVDFKKSKEVVDPKETKRDGEVTKKEQDGSIEKASGDTGTNGVNNGGTIMPDARKENNRGEECDLSSNSCTDEKKALVACLRVPGNESPDLSLLVQNRGKGPLNVKISAPDFVRLEKKQIQLQEKEDKKVKVSIRKGGTDNFIILTAEYGNCSIDLRDLVSQNLRKEADRTPQSTYLNLLKQSPTTWIIFFAAIMVLASVILCINFRSRHLGLNSPKYQRLDDELPVLKAVKMESGSNDGWDNGWGDDWDDEEAPKTPSLPVTPCLSAKGISSRRISKEGWKD